MKLSKIHFHPNNKSCVFLFPHAGGMASYFYKWKHHFNNNFNLYGVEYPGRGIRIKDTMIMNFNELLNDLRDNILPYLNENNILIGQSLGAYLAFELSNIFQFQHKLCPKLLAVISAVAPSMFDTQKIKILLNLSNQDLMNYLKKMGEYVEKSINELPDKTYFLDLIRADFNVISSYHFIKKGVLKCPLLSLIGDRDEICSSEITNSEWSQLSHQFQLIPFQGDHFFSNEKIPEISIVLNSILNSFSVL